MNAPMTIETMLQQCSDRIDHLAARKHNERPHQLTLWVVMIGSQCIEYPMLDGVAIINCKPEIGSIDTTATRFQRARAAHNVASKTVNGKGERGEAVRVGDAYARCISELEKVRQYLRDAAVAQHEAP